MKKNMEKRALISVSDKTGVVEFAKEIVRKHGYSILSTGGTAKLLAANGVPVTEVSDYTGFPEMMNGRVKTLHPKIHGGLLCLRSSEEHMAQAKEHGIGMIDLVVVNLYPFEATVAKPDSTLEDAIENIDIGGPSMLRSAAKNHASVTVVCDSKDYPRTLEALRKGGEELQSLRRELALKVYQRTSAYDAAIANYLNAKYKNNELPDTLNVGLPLVQKMRYGENPHQSAAFYRNALPNTACIAEAKQLNGKELSFNNINDTEGALACLKEFEKPAVVAVKHANPCGVAIGKDLYEAYIKAHDCDPVSIFGGIVACNRTVDAKTAAEMNKIFLEIVIAPDFDKDALEILEAKANIRLLKLPGIMEKAPAGTIDMKKVSGGLLIQDVDGGLFDAKNAPKPDQPATDAGGKGSSAAGKFIRNDSLLVVTDKEPEEREIDDMEIAMKVVKHTKSNGIVFVKDGATIAIGPGQTNRIWAVENGIKRTLFDMKGAVMASDAFFPFDDCVTAAAQAGVTAIIQPGGSMRDQESIDKANEMGIAMVFSGMRHFKH